MPEKIRRGNFLNAGNESVTDYLVESYTTFSRVDDNLNAEHLVVAVVNQLREKLGFSLKMETSQSEKNPKHLKVTFTPSQPVNYEFFNASGIFWSSIRTIDSGIRMAGDVSPEDAQTIFLAQMAGIDTIQIIRDTGEWSAAMAEISAQLPAVNRHGGMGVVPTLFEPKEKG